MPKCSAVLIYFDQLLTIKKTANHHHDSSTHFVPLATLKGLLDIDYKTQRKSEGKRETERQERKKERKTGRSRDGWGK